MKIRALVSLAFIVLTSAGAVAQSKPEEVVFSIGRRQLHGFLWKPEGSGPFPAMVWNHGSEKLPGSQPGLANFYTAHSYVFFVPHRRGQGLLGDQGQGPGVTRRAGHDLATGPPARRRSVGGYSAFVGPRIPLPVDRADLRSPSGP